MKLFNRKKKETQKEYVRMPDYVRDKNGNFINLLNIRVIKTGRDTDLYTLETFENKKIDDVILFDYTSPIAFELPSNRPELVKNIMSMYLEQRSTEQLSQMSYTYIGDIRKGEDGKLYYFNEPPTPETAQIINEEEKVFQQKRAQAIDRMKRAQIDRGKSDFLERIKIDQNMQKLSQLDYEERKDRINNAYFRYQNDFYGKEGYDAINLESGYIMLIRNMKKYKDNFGRYLYTAYIRQTNEETYTEYGEPIGYSIAFTTPSRLSDLVASKDSNETSGRIVQSLQMLLSKSVNSLEKAQNVNGLIDIGGIDLNGSIIENSQRYGVSSALVNQINILGAKKLDSLER